ncbi:hypothetical protein DFH06DRAFT_1329664 [Mycena polygramma]|nr:hypothetical protein DFH06DRAFT_1329664 [Mycena polygramma]
MDDLPAEIVDKILGLAMGPQSDFAANSLTRAAAVRVCRRWRDFVYENSSFWRTVTLFRFMSREHITFTLHKALQAQDIRLVVDAQEYDSMTDGHRTIAVVCRSLTDWNAVVSDVMAEVFDAVGQLRVEASNCADWASVMAPFMCLPSAALHRVEAYTRGLASSQRDIDIPREGAVWSSVTTMNLDAVNPMWFGAPVFSGLTELALGRVWGSFRVDTTSLLAVLESARQLTVLKLQDVDSIPQQRPRTTVTLSRLTHFCFVYSRNPCTILLRHLHLPHVRHLRVHAVNRASTFLDVSSKWSLVPSRLSSTSGFSRCVDIISEVASRDFGHEGPRAISVMESELVHQRDVLFNVNLHSLNDDMGGPNVLHGPRCSLEYTVEVEHKRHRYTRKSNGEGYIVETNAEAVDCIWNSYPTRALPEQWLE